MGKRCELYTNCKSLKYIFTEVNLNLKQRRCLELTKDYDLGINYHPGKGNVVVDALNRRSHVSPLVVDSMPFELCKEFDKLNLRIIANTLVQVYFKRIVRVKWKIRRSKRLSTTPRKRSHLAFWRMRKVCCRTN
jgi:hypothetical protein